MGLPLGYSVEILRTACNEDRELLSAIDELILQAWRDHEPVVADWLLQQPPTADVEDAWVWVVRKGSELAGTARVTIHSSAAELPRSYFFEGLEDQLPGPVASMNRLSVVKPHDGQGLATFLDHSRIEKAREAGARSVAVICQPRRAAALEKYCGLKTLTEPRSGKAIPEVKWCVSAKQLTSA